ncbi:hypothetical protein AAC387_Pa06g3148 [Persea americana]
MADIRTHLIGDGIDTIYTAWIHHGEIGSQNCAIARTSNYNEDVLPLMVDMVNDVFECVHDEDDAKASVAGSASPCMNETNDQEFAQSQDDSPENIRYKKLMEDAMQSLYPSCKIKHTKLSVIVEMLSMKAMHKWSNSSFTELLQLFKDVLPSEILYQITPTLPRR